VIAGEIDPELVEVDAIWLLSIAHRLFDLADHTRVHSLPSFAFDFLLVAPHPHGRGQPVGTGKSKNKKSTQAQSRPVPAEILPIQFEEAMWLMAGVTSMLASV
jgi:hypothetical protein